MAKKHKVIIETDVKGGPKLKKAQQQTEKHAKSLDKQAKASKRAHRADTARYNHEKQAVLQTAPAAKNFSKMSRSMDGGTGAGGLVRAYALLAANVFALSAAFGVLSRAAQVDTLMQSMKTLETVTGQSVRVIGMELQKVSGFGMDLAESMRATSLALSAGFDSSTIKELGEVARNAAVSLGRPMGDALDRIFRGVIKVEPELLDEIGLFVRVKEASAKYASELGIAASELTEFQKRQAFANEAITQGQDKFEAFANVETDPYSQLASAFSDLAQDIMSLVNVPLKMMINVLTGSKAVLIGVFAAVAGILLKKAIPAMGFFAVSSAQAAQDAVQANQDYRNDLNIGVNAQREAAEKNIKVLQDKAKKERDILKKARMESKKDFKGQTGKGGVALQKANAKLADKNLRGEKKILALEQKKLALTKSKRKVNAKAIENAKTALDKEIAAEKELIRLAKQRRDIKKEFPTLTPEKGTSAARTAKSLETDQAMTGGIATAVSTGEFKGVRAGFKSLREESSKLTKQGKAGKITFGGWNKSMFLLKGSTQLATLAVQSMMAAVQGFLIVGTILVTIISKILKANGHWGSSYQALQASQKKVTEQLKDMKDKTDAQATAMFTAERGTKKFAQANQAMARTLADSASAMADLDRATTRFYANKTGVEEFFDFMKFIGSGIGISQAEMQKLESASEDFLIGALSGADEMNAAVMAEFGNRKELSELQIAQEARRKRQSETDAAIDKNMKKQLDLAKDFANQNSITLAQAFQNVSVQQRIRGLESTRNELIKGRDKDEEKVNEKLKVAVDMLMKQGVSYERIAILSEEQAISAANLESVLEGAKDASRELADKFIKSTIVDKPLASLISLRKQIEASNEALDSRQRENFVARIKKGEEAVLDFLSAGERERVGMISDEEMLIKILDKAIMRNRERQEILVLTTSRLEKMKIIQSSINKLSKETHGFSRQNANIETKRLQIAKDQAEMNTQMKMDAAKLTEEQFLVVTGAQELTKLGENRAKVLEKTGASEEDILAIQALRNTEANKALQLRIDAATKELKIEQDIANIAMKRFKEQEKLSKLQTQAALLQAKIQKQFRVDKKLNPIEEAKLMKKAEIERKKMAEKEREIQFVLIELNFALLRAEAEIIHERQLLAGSIPKELATLAEIDQALTAAQEASKQVFDMEKNNEQLTSNLAIMEKLGEALSSSFTTGIINDFESPGSRLSRAFQAGAEKMSNIDIAGTTEERDKAEGVKDFAEGIDAFLIKRINNLKTAMEAVMYGDSGNSEIIAKFQVGLDQLNKGLENNKVILENVNKELDKIEQKERSQMLDVLTVQFEVLGVAVQNFAESVSQFGPSGVVAATFAEFGMSLSNSFLELTKKIEKGTATMVDRLAIAANAIAGVAKIASAVSAAKVAGIDKEIEAEKRLDGKSKASLARIEQMEKRKEAQKKKAFNINKKLMMAQIVVQTALGMQAASTAAMLGSTAAGPAAPVLFGKLMGILPPIIMAMGAASLAIVAGTSYAGGGSIGSAPSAPGSITVGKRDNKVDVSQRASAGELAFLRGDKGVGTNANNFQAMGGAAGLRKGYAEGGIIVGERGPEMISPTAGFNVTPNDALGGKPVEAHITINAIDARGVEEVLMEQQGNIIGMIRSAANDYGEEFLESVETDYLIGGSPKSAGGVDY